jgi:phage-related protein
VADRDIAVKFTGDTRDLERASDKAERSVEGTGKSMGGALAGIAGPAAIAGAAVAGLAVVGWDLAQAAAEDEASASQLAQQLHQAAGASDEAVAGAENYIEALSKTAAIADDELRPALATLATATGDTTKAQELLSLATDISAGTGKDLGTVTQALAKAQLGSIGGLSKLGIATEDADGKALSLEETLDKARNTFHGAGEAAANTSAGGLKKAGIGFDELKEKIGSKLLPILGSLGEFFNDKVLPAFDSLVAWAEEEWPKFLESIQPTLTDLQDTFTTVIDAIKGLWDEWGDDILKVVGWIVDAWKNYLALEIKIAGDIIRGVIEGLKAFWAEWGDQITETVTNIVNGIKDLATRFSELVTQVGDAIKQFWAEHGEEIKEFLRSLKELFDELVKKFNEEVKPAVEALAKLFFDKFTEIKDNVTGAIKTIEDFWAEHGETIKHTAEITWGIISTVIGGALDVVTGLIKTAVSILKGDWGGAWDNVKDTVSKGFDFIKDLFGKIGGMIGTALGGLADLITKPFKSAFNAIADLWNNTIGKLSFTFPEWIPGLGGNRIDVPDIPRFSTFGALTIVMPPGSDGYDVARQVSSFSRNVAPMGALTVAVR